MSAKPAAIPFFGDAYLADTTHLTTEEHGAYFLLMLAAWRQDDCGLPDDDKKLARIAGLTARKWTSISNTIRGFWFTENGRIYQPRLLKEWRFACKKSEANRKAAEARWEKQDIENKGSDGCERISDRNAPPPPPPPTEEPSGSSPPVIPHALIDPDKIPQWLPVEQWNAFVEMRAKTIKSPLSPRAVTLAINNLDELQRDGHDPGQVLDQSTLNNWKGLFPIKDANHGNRSQTNRRNSPGAQRDDRDHFARAIDDVGGFHYDRSDQPAEASERHTTGPGGDGGEPPSAEVIPFIR